MQRNPTWLPVVALALRRADGAVLLQQRLPGKRHGGAWEFPGGKVEIEENPRVALVREIEEELGLVVRAEDMCPVSFAEEAGDPAIVLFLYSSDCWVGEAVGRDGQSWGWFGLQAARQMPLAPMDRQLLAALLQNVP